MNKVESLEKKILEKEKEILSEVKSEEKKLSDLNRKIMMISVFTVLIVGGAIGAFTYWSVSSTRISIEKSQITAPQIDLASQGSGILQEVYVQEGDKISANTPVARIGNELIKSKVGGIVISVKNDLGKIFNRGESVVTMINPDDLRVIGQIEEDKGLKDIHVGQNATFTVDAFGSKEYQGIVDEISPTSREGDLVFSISDKRELKEFNVKVRFDTDQYPELKNGMSAKILIFKS